MPSSSDWLAVVAISDASTRPALEQQIALLKEIPAIRRVGLLAPSSSSWLRDTTLNVDFRIADSWQDGVSLSQLRGQMVTGEHRLLVCFTEHPLSRDAVQGFLEHHVTTAGGESVFTPGIYETWRLAPMARAWDIDHLPDPPAPEVEVPLGAVQPELGHSYVGHTGLMELSSHEQPSSATLCEDGLPLSARNAQHADIRTLGCGRYSFWHDYVCFSASDNSDPRTNGRRYTIRYSPATATEPVRTGLSRLLSRWTKPADVPAVVRKNPPAVASETPEIFLGTQRDQMEFLVDRVEEFYPFPRVVNLVLTNLCNLKCVMCPYHSPEYPDLSGYMATRKYMSDEIFERAALEAAANGSWLKMGQLEEVFMHPKLIPMIQRAHQLGVPHMHITSNGTLLNAKRSEALMTSGLTRLNISVDALKPETYKKIRGWDLDRLLKNIDELLEIRQRVGSTTEIYIAMILQGDAVDEEKEFLEFWRKKGVEGVVVYQLFEAYDGPTDFKAKYFESEASATRHACQSVWQECYVYPEGEVSTCCTTLALVPKVGIISSGNIKQQSLRDVWLGPEYSGLRKRLLLNDIENDVACNSCDIWRSCELITERRNGYTVEITPTMATHNFRR